MKKYSLECNAKKIPPVWGYKNSFEHYLEKYGTLTEELLNMW